MVRGAPWKGLGRGGEWLDKWIFPEERKNFTTNPGEGFVAGGEMGLEGEDEGWHREGLGRMEEGE